MVIVVTEKQQSTLSVCGRILKTIYEFMILITLFNKLAVKNVFFCSEVTNISIIDSVFKL